VSRDDLATLRRLQEEFAADLASLRSRVDNLEARSAELQVNQFHHYQAYRSSNLCREWGGFSGSRIVDPTGALISDEDPNATILYRAALDLNTSFSGTDLLKIRLDTAIAVMITRGFFGAYVRQCPEFLLNRPDPVSSGLVGCTIPLPV